MANKCPFCGVNDVELDIEITTESENGQHAYSTYLACHDCFRKELARLGTTREPRIRTMRVKKA